MIALFLVNKMWWRNKENIPLATSVGKPARVVGVERITKLQY